MTGVSKADMIDIIERLSNLNPELNNSEVLESLIGDANNIMYEMGLKGENKNE